MFLIDFTVGETESMANYANAIGELSCTTGREIIAAPYGIEYAIVDFLRLGGVAVRCVSLDELQQIRDQEEVTVFRV